MYKLGSFSKNQYRLKSSGVQSYGNQLNEEGMKIPIYYYEYDVVEFIWMKDII